MKDTDICGLGAVELAALYRERSLSPVEVVEASLARIEAANPALNAVILTAPDAALEGAKAAEAAFGRGEDPGPLAGIPVSVKDNIFTKGMRSTSGTPLFRDYVPDEDSGVVAAAKAAGAIVVGKTNTPAFGWTAITDNLVFGETKNPWDPALTCGGSSGGGAVSVATGMVPIGIGTDGGGSLRTPGAFCGVVGFKPSHGRFPDVPAHTHWLFQHYGPLARCVADAALFLDAAAGPDPRDPHSLARAPGSFLAAVAAAPRPGRALFTTQFGWTEALDPEIEAACREAVAALAAEGWEIEERDLAWTDPSPFASVIQSLGLRKRLEGFLHRRDEIEAGILDIVAFADALPPNAFYEAYLARNQWCAQPLSAIRGFDVMITPATAAPPFPLGRFHPASVAGRQIPPGAWNPFLRVFNITGQPAISVPVGTTAAGLPIGMQIAGPREGDAAVLAAAAAVERLFPPRRWAPA